MKVIVIRQSPVDFLRYEGEVLFDPSPGELVIIPATFVLFGTEVELKEERFAPQEGDRLYITEQGLVLVRDNMEVDLEQFGKHDLFGWVEEDTFKYLLHPSPKTKEEV